MKRKVLGILVCMMMLALIPVAAGLTTELEPQTTGVLDKTTVRGIVLFPRLSFGGKNIVFFALRLHYRTVGVAESQTGIIRCQRVSIPNDLNGFMGNFYIFGTFRGNVE